MMTAEQVEWCRGIGRDEVNRVSLIGLAELDALCDMALQLIELKKQKDKVRLSTCLGGPALGCICPDCVKEHFDTEKISSVELKDGGKTITLIDAILRLCVSVNKLNITMEESRGH
jgi:hypothetical protein